MKRLEAEIRELEEKVRAKAAEKASVAARMQAHVFLERIFMPYIEGLCEGLGLSPEDGVRHLVKEGKTLDALAYENREALGEVLSQTEIRVMTAAAANPLAKVSDEWIRETTGTLLKVMEKIRPSLANVISETPGGRDWFADSLTGLRGILFGKPKILEPPKVK